MFLINFCCHIQQTDCIFFQIGVNVANRYQAYLEPRSELSYIWLGELDAFFKNVRKFPLFQHLTDQIVLKKT